MFDRIFEVDVRESCGVAKLNCTAEIDALFKGVAFEPLLFVCRIYSSKAGF